MEIFISKKVGFTGAELERHGVTASVTQDTDDSIHSLREKTIKQVTENRYTNEESHNVWVLFDKFTIDGHKNESMRTHLLILFFWIEKKVKLNQ
jgi:hypothetical protein